MVVEAELVQEKAAGEEVSVPETEEVVAESVQGSGEEAEALGSARAVEVSEQAEVWVLRRAPDR